MNISLLPFPLLTTLLLSLASLPSLQAQIYYQDITPDILINTWNNKTIHIDLPPDASPSTPGTLFIWREGDNTVNINTFGNCQVFMQNGYPAALQHGAEIASGGTWSQPNYAHLNRLSQQGNWIGVHDRYLGVRIKKESQWYYGWIRMDVDSAGSSVTIKDYACNRTAATAITAGEGALTSIENLGFDKECTSIAQPNPFSTETTLNVESIDLHEATLHIYTALGKEVRQQHVISGKNIIIPRGFLSTGMYFYTIVQNARVTLSGSLMIID